MNILSEGYLRELSHQVSSPISYSFVTDAGGFDLNPYLGQQIRLQHSGRKSCIHCGRSIRKVYQGGYCFPCVTTLAECDLCIVKPHECHYEQGTCRDVSFAQTHCMTPHYVYLAVSSGAKVGLTRKGRQFTRWVDQGAQRATLLAEFSSRKLAGEFEMQVATVMPDKTDWRKMLRGEDIDPVDLVELKQEIMLRFPQLQGGKYVDEQDVHHFEYPRLAEFKVKTTSLSLEKTATVQGTLRGVKGQYLLFDEGVLNVKKHAGFHVQVSLE